MVELCNPFVAFIIHTFPTWNTFRSFYVFPLEDWGSKMLGTKSNLRNTFINIDAEIPQIHVLFSASEFTVSVSGGVDAKIRKTPIALINMYI